MGVGSLETLYNFYSDMKYFGNYTHQEIDEMYPFEREIYFGLLKKTLNEIKNQKSKNTTE